MGNTLNATQSDPSLCVKGLMSKASSADVLAPVSTLAFIAGKPSPGKLTHSRHPSISACVERSTGDTSLLCVIRFSL
jgi:hypothetical protein